MTHNHNTIRKQLTQLFGRKCNVRGTLALVKNWLAFIACMYLIALLPLTGNWALFLCAYLPLSFVAGCTLRGFDNLTHEASHHNIFTRAGLHHRLQFLFAYPVFKTIGDYQPGHWKHHRNFRNNKDDDPDTQQNIRWGVEHLPASKTVKQVLWFYVARFFLLYYVVDNIRHNLVPHLTSKKERVGRLLFWAVVLLVVALTGAWLFFVLGFLVPYIVWLPYIRFVTESSKHTNVHLDDDFANSRNNIGWLHQYLLHPHNDGFHQMHHYLASIPFYNLKKAYRYIRSIPGVRESLIESHHPVQTIQQIFSKP